MPDRYDPKLTVRPPGERKQAAAAGEDDPLAELARIVTGRSTFDPPPAEKSRTVPASDDAGDSDLNADLESELLNDLQASFAALGEPFGETEPAAPEAHDPEPVTFVEEQVEVFETSEEPQPEPSSDLEATRSPTEFEPAPVAPPPAAEPEPMATVEDVLAELRVPDDVPMERRATEAPPPVSDPPPPSSEAVEPPPAALMPPPRQLYREPPLQAEPTAPPPSEEPPPAPISPVPEDPAVSRRAARATRPATRSDFSRLRLRPSRPGAADEDDVIPAGESGPQAVAGRRQGTELTRRGDDRPGRFTPPRAAARVRPEPPRPIAAQPEAAAAEPPSRHAPAVDDRGFADDFSLEDLDTATYAPEDDLPPFPEEELASHKRRRSGRVFAVLGGVFVVALAGAAAAYFMRGDTVSDAPPPVIVADSTPTKVFPDEPAATDQDEQGKLIYDRVDDGGAGTETTLVTRDDAIAEVPTGDENLADNPIARVIVPGGPGIDGPIADGGDGASAVVAGAETDIPADGSLGPKKVRTVVVRPDGTIVSSEAVEEGSLTGAAVLAADGTADAQSSELRGVATDARTDMDAVLDGQDVAVDPDPLGVTDPDRGLALTAETEAPVDQATETVVAAVETTTVTEAPVEALPTPQPEQAATPAPAPTPEPAPAPSSQTSGSGGPIDLAAGTAPATAAPTLGSGESLVQVSAQRTEEAARSTYASLQSRFPGILGPYQAAIIRADLGDRGIYYRVRIGPFSNSDATRLCEDLKSAGGDCILAR